MGAGASTGELLRQAGLPESLAEGGDGFVPFRSLLRFIGLSARSQGIPDLCWRGVHQARSDQLGGWGRAVAHCSTVRSAIRTFCERFPEDIPFVDLGLAIGDERAWFWRRRPEQVVGWLGDEEGQQFALSAMIRVARTAAGPHWVPDKVQLESATAAWVSDIPELAECRIDLGSSMVAIEVPYDLLDQSTAWASADGLEAAGAPKPLAAEETLAGSLQQAFASLLPAVHPSIEVAAEIAEISPRTLRRRLAEEGTTWRKVVDRTRLEACERLLRNPDLTLGEISGRLRYSGQAHLTRAFQRWMGESPSAYRRRRYGRVMPA
jgi:AraC-like DNA-binding protein